VVQIKFGATSGLLMNPVYFPYPPQLAFVNSIAERLRTTPIFKEGLQQRFATGEMGCIGVASLSGLIWIKAKSDSAY
jgi:hypothetical protein